MAAESSSTSDADFFLYTRGRTSVPLDVRRVRVDPSVTAIPEDSFRGRKLLEVVELCEGLVGIGDHAFYDCARLERLTLPTTVRSLGSHAFHFSPLSSLRLPDGLENIGEWTFCGARFRVFRIPPLLTVVSLGLFGSCDRMFSLELPESIGKIEHWASSTGCRSLRNVAIPPDAEVDMESFTGCKDLRQLFRSDDHMIYALKHRFARLPIHKLLHYQSYRPVTVDDLKKATNMRSNQRRSLRSKLEPTGNKQDCLGMTPLHILACSTAHDLELFRVIIEMYPENLITADGWGALPILYAIWSDAPSAIVQLLVNGYRHVHPDHELNWSDMVETLGKADASLQAIQNLLDVQQAFFPSQHIVWDTVLENLAANDFSINRANRKTFWFLVKCSISKRLNAIGPKQWRNAITTQVENSSFIHHRERSQKMTEIHAKLAFFEAEYHKLKEATSILELALWKANIRESESTKKKKRRTKKIKTDESVVFRQQCRISCGAGHVIENVLLFLLPGDE